MLRCILLTGGNSAGKTTALREARDRLMVSSAVQLMPEWVIFADLNGEFKAKGKRAAPDQFKAVMRRWVDPTVPLLLIEGVRIYSAVLRCLAFQGVYGVRRALKAGLLLRTDSVGAAHIKARCERRGKPYNHAFWESGKVTDLFSNRYTRAFKAFPTQYPDAPLHEVKEFWIGTHYTELLAVGTWIDAAVTEEWT